MDTRENYDAAGMQRREGDTIRFARHPMYRPARQNDVPSLTVAGLGAISDLVPAHPYTL
jgi:hypothetical protein